MMVFIEVLIFLSTVLPLFHLLNALFTRKRQTNIMPAKEKRLSILIPCYNEEDTVAVSLKGLLNINYRNFEAIYINDGSSDGTMKTLDRLLGLEKIDGMAAFETEKDMLRNHKDFYCNTRALGIKAVYRSKKRKNFYVIDKSNGGKSESLNAGIRFAKSELIVTLDADSVIERDALRRMSAAFDDADVVAAGGSIHIMQGYDPDYLKGSYNRRRKTLITLQILEYLKGFYIYKLSLAKQDATAIISGAFGVFTKKILLASGGFRKTLGEDIDITLRIQQIIHKTKQKIVYLPDALCYTQCPESWCDLRKQRIRWQKGFVNCVGHYKWFLLKTFLVKSLTFHFFVEALLVGVCSCLFTIFTYVFVFVLAFGDIQTVCVFSIYYAFGVAFNLIYAVTAVAISLKYNRYPRAIMKKVCMALLLDILFYRFFNLFMYIGGTVSYLWSRKGKDAWNKVARQKTGLYFYGASGDA